MTRPANKGADTAPISYEDSKRLARDENQEVRARLALREDLRPEILYFMAEDDSAQVRGRIAANRATPRQADLILARDRDEAVRQKLADKIADLLPELDAGGQEQARIYLIEVIEILAQDQAARIRQIIAETLKDVAAAPPHVIQQLARDAEAMVACPVLEFSPLLSDSDLIEIIETGSGAKQLQAISRRYGVGEQVADAIVAAQDTGSVAALLENDSAQIREDALDGLVDKAVKVTAWHKPLVLRPVLPAGAVRKLAGFVAGSLLSMLQARQDLDRKTARAVAKEVKRRIKADQSKQSKQSKAAAEDPAAEANRLFNAGQLDDEVLNRAVNAGDREMVRHGLALRADMPVALVDHILSAHSAKGVTALAWKAGCAMRLATQLQLRMGGIPPTQALNPKAGTDYPLSENEMVWQLEFFEGLTGWSDK
jgi:uncharacterized protein (DUF2336 family)